MKTVSFSFCVFLPAIICWFIAPCSAAHAQTTNPLDFFPHAIGNTWEYTDGETGRVFFTRALVGDTVNAAGDTLIKYNINYPGAPVASVGWYLIDSLHRVFVSSVPNDMRIYLLYKLDAQLGDQWRVRSSDTVLWARVIDYSSTAIFKVPATRMQVEYYDSAQDVVIWENVNTIATGFGLVECRTHPFGYYYLSGAIINGKRYGTLVSSVENDDDASDVMLDALPNPFTAGTIISYALPSAGDVRLLIHDLLGREVLQLADGHQEAGEYRARLDGAELPAGIYLLSLAHNGTRTCRTIRLRR